MTTPYGSDWRVVRLAVLERDNHICQLQLDGCTHHADAVDHIVPLIEGGDRLDQRNLRASCTHCNGRRARHRQAELARHTLDWAMGATPHPSREW